MTHLEVLTVLQLIQNAIEHLQNVANCLEGICKVLPDGSEEKQQNISRMIDEVSAGVSIPSLPALTGLMPEVLQAKTQVEVIEPFSMLAEEYPDHEAFTCNRGSDPHWFRAVELVYNDMTVSEHEESAQLYLRCLSLYDFLRRQSDANGQNESGE